MIINFVDDNGDGDAISRQAKGEALSLRGYCYMLFADAYAFLREIENEHRRKFVGERLCWIDMYRFGSRTAGLKLCLKI